MLSALSSSDISSLVAYLGFDAAKPVFGVADKAGLKPVSSATETSKKIKILLVRYDPFQNLNNKGADQSALMRRLVCAFVVHKPPKTNFLTSRHRQYGSRSDCTLRSSLIRFHSVCFQDRSILECIEYMQQT